MNGTEDDLKSLTYWEVVGSTFAAALGVQSHKNRKRDFSRGNVLAFIFSGIVFTAGFVVAVIVAVDVIIS